MSARKPPRPSGPSGAPLTPARHRELGRARISAWLPADVVAQLDALAKRWRTSRAGALVRMIGESAR